MAFFVYTIPLINFINTNSQLKQVKDPAQSVKATYVIDPSDASQDDSNEQKLNESFIEPFNVPDYHDIRVELLKQNQQVWEEQKGMYRHQEILLQCDANMF